MDSVSELNWANVWSSGQGVSYLLLGRILNRHEWQPQRIVFEPRYETPMGTSEEINMIISY